MARLAVVLPAYDEEGLVDYLGELDHHLRDLADEVGFVVVDDHSPVPVSGRVAGVALASGAAVHVLRNDENLGHGPSALRAYRAGIALGADLVLHVDGDGQFPGADVAALVRRLDRADGVVAVRRTRRDPWFRRVLTLVASLVAHPRGLGRVDANSPLRLYRAAALRLVLGLVAPDALVPHLHFTRLERRVGLQVARLEVEHRPRLGDSCVGTTWGRSRTGSYLPGRRLLRFSLLALLEVLGHGDRLGAAGSPAAAGRESQKEGRSARISA